MALFAEAVFFFCFDGFLETGDGFPWSKLAAARKVDESMLCFRRVEINRKEKRSTRDCGGKGNKRNE